MSKRPRILRAHHQIIGSLPLVNPDAAGIDAGSQSHFVSVPEDRKGEHVRSFGTFTEDLYALADWLVECGIKSVAIEATGVYWIPLVEILEARPIDVKLVDARSIGRRNKKKTDVLDCQWIRQLHMHGLLDGAFRPSAEMLPLRAFMRQRRMLIEYAADHIRHMQKALDLMNLKLHTVISDITGETGLRIIRAILTGTRDPQELAAMRDPKCKNPEEVIAKALMGNYREEHLFTLRQAMDLFETYQKKIAECDERLAAELASFERKSELPPLSEKKKTTRRKNQPRFDGRTLLYQMSGVDLTAIHGMEVSTVLTILSETGTDMSAWPTASHFSSWLALSPNKLVSGGRTLPKKGPRIRPNRAAQAFRLAAQTLEKVPCGLGAFFRRIQSRFGRVAAIKATARKLSVIFYSMLKNKTKYQDLGDGYYEQRYQERLLKSLERKALSLGYQLIPNPTVPA